jgi:hypothetical protein
MARVVQEVADPWFRTKTGIQLLNLIKIANKSKQKNQKLQSKINWKQEKEDLRAQKNEKLKIREH